MHNDLIYLASPYTSAFSYVMSARYHNTVRATAALVKAGYLVFSPIVHSVPLVECGEMGTEWSDWAEYDLKMIDRSDAVAVLKLTGWRESVGVTAEIKHAKAMGLKLYEVHPVTYEITTFKEDSDDGTA